MKGKLAAVASKSASWVVFRTHPSCRQRAGGIPSVIPGWLRSEPVVAARNACEEVTRDGDLGHLEDEIAAMADALYANLEVRLAGRGEGPAFNHLRLR